MSWLLDSSVVIDCLCRIPTATRYLSELPERPSISVVTIAEVGAGARSQAEQNDIKAFWRTVHVLAVTRDIAERAGGHIRLFGASHAVEPADALIAATAEHHGLALATLNMKHFPMFRKLRRPY